ncbi:Actin-related protein 4 [Gracilariopsis chorda]|uniref:Actin-related protein 4 n=1 Tax=Gracilariopsis chorda TaxID=448386 RepID=A0A2V3INT7_9FLOR|nr:Actin-related protein 4 [Gracilariopsis chorda]|eukprot:PXF43717.1 Actin-related protein 4 [Gracilariopsis chorda]
MTAAKTVLGSDDIRAIVADCGTYHIRIGSSGDDTPRAIIPSAVGLEHTKADVEMLDVNKNEGKESDKKQNSYVAGDVLLNAPRRICHVIPIHDFEKQQINWDAMQTCWESGLNSLQIKPDAPFLIIEPARMWSPENRAKALERAFEGLHVPAAFIAKGSAMSAFASARTSACVIDVGYYDSCAVPVVDGYAVQRKIVKSVVGGKYISDMLYDWANNILDGRLNHDGTEHRTKRLRDDETKKVDWIRAHHEIKKERLDGVGTKREFRVTDVSNQGALAQATEYQRQFYRLRIMDDMKVSTFRVSQTRMGENGTTKESDKGSNNDGKAKTNKDGAARDGNGKEDDGKNSKEGKEGKESKSKDKGTTERSTEYCLPDGNILNLNDNDGLAIPDMLFRTDEAKGMLSISEMAFKAVSGCDVDLRRDLFNSVVITGGTSLMPGLVERVTRELALMSPQAYKLKVYAPSNYVERTCASWIGGSIVSSLGTFQQAWISRAEYDELGAMNALRKCP